MDFKDSSGDSQWPAAIAESLIKLFHDGVGEDLVTSQKLEKIHSNPSIYFVRDFLSDSDIDYFSQHVAADESAVNSGPEVDGSEMVGATKSSTSTSIFISKHLKKGGDATILSIEEKAIGTSILLYLSVRLFILPAVSILHETWLISPSITR